MKEEQKPLYFIAIIPPEENRTKYQRLKEHFKKEFKTFSALRSPPHITLIPPFRMGARKFDAAVSEIKGACREIKPFQVHVNGYGRFDKRVIFAHPLKSDEMSAAKKHVEKALSFHFPKMLSKNNRPFNPHITLAYKDLKEKHFEAAWESLKSLPLEDSFMVKKITLLDLNKGIWKPKFEFALGENGKMSE